ncbi:E3 ubiquitin-protein ligase SHPRH-like [Myzus persicae]|uniref:E3 ubiquitin-protein ligase SHPRH-like n=1 Tax=Myzus persicae TaxID=13164 RepID=UPI000B93617C|nr:E3 ubiquitin-protein ligase SHPRH-like [Myzus persicae]
MPNSVSNSPQPGPSGAARRAKAPKRTRWARIQAAAARKRAAAAKKRAEKLQALAPPSPPKYTVITMPNGDMILQIYQEPGDMPQIVEMMTKKNFPLLMCSEDDGYNPLLLKSIQFYHQDTKDRLVVPPHIKLNVTYDSYHRKTVSWMVDIERRNSINDQSQFTSGILADVLDEDKRLEMISCIVANTAPTITYRQKVLLDGRSEKLKSEFPIPLHSKCITSKINKTFYYGPKIFNTLIKDRSQSIIQRLSNRLYLSKRNVGSEENLACYCNNIPSKSSLLICEMCGEAQHKKCVVYDPRTEGGLPYLCSSCWTFNDPIQCRATLIVVPDNCLELWNQDIKRIVSPALKCFVYNGLQSCNFIQPTIFNNYDVVLISYSKIEKELKYGLYYVDENQVTTGLRWFKKYPKSPLLCINWWRICLDQPQSYNKNIEKILTNLLPLRSGHKWILPGALIQDSPQDFFSIVKYLNLLGDKFDDIDFIQAVKEKKEDLIIWISKFVWSNLIRNIHLELNLPFPIHEIHWLSFPPIENYFYKNCERFYASYIKNKGNSALMNKLMDVDGDTKLDIVGAILILLEACVVPTIRGEEMLNINGTFGLRYTLEERKVKYHGECNTLLHQWAECLTNLAEVHTFVLNKSGYYMDLVVTDLMQLMNNFYKSTFTIGTDYELLEMVFKFINLLKENASVKLRFPDIARYYLENAIIDLESNILKVHPINILKKRNILRRKLFETSDMTEKFNSLKHNYWWIKMLECISSPLDFLMEVKTTIDNNLKSSIPNIVNKLKSLDDVNFTLTNWLTDTITTRNSLVSTYRTLDRNSRGNIVEYCCAKAFCTTGNECLLCQFEHKLHHYKRLLFNDNIENIDENIIKNLNESNREQTVSQYEILLRSLILCENNNSVTDDYIKKATEHMEILNILSSEFLCMWNLWLSLDKYKNSCKQIIKAKSKPTVDDVLAKIQEPGKHTTKKKKMKVNVADPKSAEITDLLTERLKELKSKNSFYFEKLKTRHKSLMALQMIPPYSNSNSTFYSCDACDSIMNEHLLLNCGHCVCNKCFIEECDATYSIQLSCPKCFLIYSMKDMERIKEYHDFGVQLNGSYCIKLESIVSKLKEFITIDEYSKVVIFSSFKTSLDCLSSALSLNSIHFMKLDSESSNSTTILNTFENSKHMTTILINLNVELNYLKLNFATRVFFMEPIMDKSFENKIVDQICSKRILPTYVHHFIIKDSIEEKISKTFTNNDTSLGMDLTLGQLAELLINETDLQID